MARLTQVHGSRVVHVSSVGRDSAPEADGLIGREVGPALAVLTADCGALALAGADGAHAAVHVGWRGLLSGVVEEALSAVAGDAGGPVWAALGPCIGPCCYRFGPADMAPIVDRYGAAAAGRTRHDEPALDLRAAIAVALAGGGVELDDSRVSCTACDGDRWFSFRRHGESARQVLLVWRVPEE